jgi:hypothetical protein
VTGGKHRAAMSDKETTCGTLSTHEWLFMGVRKTSENQG